MNTDQIPNASLQQNPIDFLVSIWQNTRGKHLQYFLDECTASLEWIVYEHFINKFLFSS